MITPYMKRHGITEMAAEQAKKTVNRLIDLLEINAYEATDNSVSLQQSRNHGIELAIDTIKRDLLDDWDGTYIRYSLAVV